MDESVGPVRGNALFGLSQPPTRKGVKGLFRLNVLRKVPSIPLGDTVPLEEMSNVPSGIVCMNCQTVITEEAIEGHSVLCTTVSVSADSVELVAHKLCKMREFLFSVKATQQLSSGDQNLLSVLHSKAGDLLQCMSQDKHLEVKKSNESVKHLGLNVRVTLNMRLYIERLFALGVELENALHSLVVASHRQKIEELKTEAERQKRDTKKRNLLKSHLGGLNITAKKINEIKSEVLSSNSFLSGDSSPNGGEFTAEFTAATRHSHGQNSQQHFYTLGLAAKLKLPANHPGKAISISALYSAALEHEVAPDAWVLFLSQQLSAPSELFGSSKRRQPFPRSRPICSIMEEDDEVN